MCRERNEVRWRLEQETGLAPPCKQLYCFEKSAYDIVVSMWPPQWFGARGIVLPSLRLWCYAIKIGKFSENKQSFKSYAMVVYSMNICNFRTQCGMDLAQTANKGYWRHFRFLRVVFVSLLCLPHAFFRRGPVFVFLIIKLFRHSTSYFFKFR